jgi:large subunit ribosomal protein L30
LKILKRRKKNREKVVTKLRITQIKSGIGAKEPQKRTLKALGFRRLNQSVTHNDSRSIRGMIEKVKHLVRVEEAGDEAG